MLDSLRRWKGWLGFLAVFESLGVTSDREGVGRRGESLACRALRRQGYQILARRLRSRLGEVDIVAREGAVLVFIEVKTRRSGKFGRPVDAVGPGKRRKLITLARAFLKRHRLGEDRVRFDVVSVELSPDRPARVDIHRGAFAEADDRAI